MTYPNPCILRSRAVTRLDYPGACITTGSTAEVICENVQTQGLCAVNNYNCDSPRLPKIGCCPVCGEKLLPIEAGDVVHINLLFDYLSRWSSDNSF